MKTRLKKQQIDEMISELSTFKVLNSYAKFLCLDADGTAFFELKNVDYDYTKKYTIDFWTMKYTCSIQVMGLKEIFYSMPVLDLLTDKGVKYFEVTIKTETNNDEEEDTYLNWVISTNENNPLL